MRQLISIRLTISNNSSSLRVLVAVLSASLAIDPAGMSFDVVLFLPNWQSDFHLVDDIATCLKGLISMSGSHSDPDCVFADLE